MAAMIPDLCLKVYENSKVDELVTKIQIESKKLPVRGIFFLNFI
jgi:hypothetical protein